MVFCVLNGYENVVELVCQFVLEVVVWLCYILYVVVCSLSSCCINMVGVVLFDLYGEFFFELMCGIDGVVCNCCQYLLVFSYYGDQEQQGVVLCVMCGCVDGLLVFLFYVESLGFLIDNLLQLLLMVLINIYLFGQDYLVLSIDDYVGVMVMICYLLDVGYCCIVFIFGLDFNFDVCECLCGFCDVLVVFGGGVEGIELFGDFDEVFGYCVGQELLVVGVLFDVVFVVNDMMVLGCLYVFMQVGVCVLVDVVLVGFDDILLVCFVYLLLIIMQVSIVEFGDWVMMCLMQLMDGIFMDGVGDKQILVFCLIVCDFIILLFGC